MSSAPENYIVVFKDSATSDDIKKYADELNQNGGTVAKTFDSAVMKGFSGSIPQSYLQQLRNLQDSVIDYIEPDQPVHIQPVDAQPGDTQPTL